MTTLSPVEAYRLLASTYDDLPNPLLSLEQRTTAAMLPELRGRKVADIAAGTGRWARYCQKRGAHAVSFDLSLEMLAQAPEPRVQADALRLPLRNASVDLAIFSFGIGYAPEALPEIARVTRPGGMVVISDIHPDALGRGWRRSFRIGEDVIEIASRHYAIGDLGVSGLTLARLAEPHFGEKERQIFERAGKLASFDASEPAVFVAQWIRNAT